MTRRLPLRAAVTAAAIGLCASALPERADAGERIDVEVEGLGGALGGLLQNQSLKGTDVRQNVLSVLSIEDHRKDENLTEARVRRLHEEAPAEIRKALEPFGYFRPTIDAGAHARRRRVARRLSRRSGPRSVRRFPRVDDHRPGGTGPGPPRGRGGLSAAPRGGRRLARLRAGEGRDRDGRGRARISRRGLRRKRDPRRSRGVHGRRRAAVRDGPALSLRARPFRAVNSSIPRSSAGT